MCRCKACDVILEEYDDPELCNRCIHAALSELDYVNDHRYQMENYDLPPLFFDSDGSKDTLF